jgi:hypothetical protein
MGKAKRLNQIAWERGFIDPLRTYTKADLVEILQGCTDFDNAETNLQMIAQSLGVQAERTPKYHCEMAGEGIEYDWGFCKGKNRCTGFQDLVKEVTAWIFVSMKQCRRSCARARSYISAYYNIHYDNSSLTKANEGGLTDTGGVVFMEDGETTAEPWKPAGAGKVISMDLIEKTKKEYQSHRGVNSFEKGIHA